MLVSAFNFWEEWELAEEVSFNGIDKIITVLPHVIKLDIRKDVWSAWVRWNGLLDRNYDRFLLAMERTGLESIPDGQTGDFYFLRNGWKLVVELDKVKITGVLYSRDYLTAYFTPELNEQFPAQVSSIVNTVTTIETVVSATKEEIANEVWTEEMEPYGEISETSAGGLVNHLRHLRYGIFVDTEKLVDGDGSQHAPFNNETSAIDYAEAHGIKQLYILADLDFTRDIKNFVLEGIGVPNIDLGGWNIQGTQILHCKVHGTYLGAATIQECNLQGLTTLNGGIENCGMSGDFTVPDGGTAFVKSCAALVIGLTKPKFSVGGLTGTANLEIMDYYGGAHIEHCNQATDDVKLTVNQGIIELDSTCTDGTIVLFGNAETLFNQNGSNVIDHTKPPSEQKDIHAAEMNRRIESGTTMTIYEDDKTTPRKVFDVTKDANGGVTEVNPQ